MPIREVPIREVPMSAHPEVPIQSAHSAHRWISTTRHDKHMTTPVPRAPTHMTIMSVHEIPTPNNVIPSFSVECPSECPFDP